MANVDSVLKENRSFPPAESFRAAAQIGDRATYDAMHRESIEDPDSFFGGIARELPWIKPFESALDWSQKPVPKWFSGGQMNASAVCLDQHFSGERRNKQAIVWEGEPGDVRSFTYAETHAQVCRMANVPKRRGVGRGELDSEVALADDLPAADALAVIEKAGKGLVVSTELFGHYRGPNLGEGKKSLAYHVILQSPNKTLSDTDSAKFLGRLERGTAQIGGELRKE